MGRLQRFLAVLREDLEAARTRDPAARSALEVALGYPGVHAVWSHRIAHRMWREPGLRLPARLLSQLTRFATGVEIHPAAQIGRGLPGGGPRDLHLRRCWTPPRCTRSQAVLAVPD